MTEFKQIASYNAIGRDDIVRIPTGIKAVDEYIDGGIAMGELTVLSSSEGSGKTTLTTQIVGYAADHGIKSLIYSGEMSGNSVISTMLRQLAGSRWSSCDQYSDGIFRPYSAECYVPDDTAAYIKGAVLADKVYFCGGDLIRRWEHLKNAMETAYAAGCRLFVIDNLMTLSALFAGDTANSAFGTDQYHQQTGAVEFLNDFAVTKNCSVILVAHTKKGGAAITDESNDGIFGTSAVKNLAGLIFRFLAPSSQERAQYKKALAAEKGEEYAGENAPDNPTDRILMVTKNRIQGKTTSITLKYEPTTCRYFDHSMEYQGKREDITSADFEQRISLCGFDYAMLWEADYIEYMAKAAGMQTTPHLPVVDGAVKYYETKARERQQRLDARNHPSDSNRRLNGSELFADIFKK